MLQHSALNYLIQIIEFVDFEEQRCWIELRLQNFNTENFMQSGFKMNC